jgi:hypothetical protein
MSIMDRVRKASHLYIGVCPECDGVVVLATDIPGEEKEMARTVADIVRSGLIPQRIAFTEYPPIERIRHTSECQRGIAVKRGREAAKPRAKQLEL